MGISKFTVNFDILEKANETHNSLVARLEEIEPESDDTIEESAVTTGSQPESDSVPAKQAWMFSSCSTGLTKGTFVYNVTQINSIWSAWAEINLCCLWLLATRQIYFVHVLS